MPAARSTRFRPRLEPLEDRCLLSGSGDPAIVPAPNPSPGWLLQAAQLVNRPPQHQSPRVLFLGDSITEFFADGAGARAWQAYIAPLGAEDLAVRASTTQNLLYLIDQGLLRGLDSRAVLLMVGVNNLLAEDTPGQTAAGVADCLAAIRQAQPQARILLLGLLPAGRTASDPLRVAVKQTNALLARLADGRAVSYADVGAPFVRPDGRLVRGMMAPDGIHPTALGYRRIAAGLAALLVLLEEEPRPPAG